SRIAAAEIAVVLGGVDGVPRREDVVEQALRDRLVVRSAGLQERLPGVGRERVRPAIAVVARGIAVAREDVGELRRPETHALLLRHAERGEGVALEGLWIDRLLCRGPEVVL